MSSSMRAVLRTADGVVTGQRPVPQDDGEQVRVRVTSAGICGSDLHAARRGASEVVLGHEFGGRLDDGRLVAVRPIRSCGACEACAVDRPQACREKMSHFLGGALDGGLADQVLVHPDQVIAVPEAVDPRHVALVEPIAVSVHAVVRGGALPQRALVVGGGSIGLLCAAVLADRGVAVDVAVRHPAQRDAARALGVGVEPGERYPLVIEAAGSPDSFESAQRLVAAGGRIVLVALPWDPLAIGMAMVLKEVDVLSSSFYDDADYAAAADALARHPEWIDALVTHRFDLDDATEAFRVAGDRASGAIKVHVLP